jgi:tetratricopeptide (TPR) repeat protein
MGGFTLATAVVLVLAVSPPVRCQSPSSQEWRQLMTRLEGAAMRGTAAELRTIRADLLRRLTASSPAEAMLQYTIAYAGWRLAVLPDVLEREQGDLLDDGVSRLQGVIKGEEKNAEAHALLGSILGLQIGRSPMKAIMLGPRATRALDRASRDARDNPRVLLTQGVSAFNTPAMFGGGTDKAERRLRQAAERFAHEPADKEWPNWGRFDVHAWLGQTLLSKGDRAGARAEYDKALAIAPDSGWLRYVLMPALDKTRK